MIKTKRLEKNDEDKVPKTDPAAPDKGGAVGGSATGSGGTNNTGGGAGSSFDIGAELRRITEKYALPDSDSLTLPPSQGLQRMEVNAKSDEDIANLASNRLADFHLNSVNAIHDNTANAASDIANQKEGLQKATDEQTRQLEELYAVASERINNDVLKRGIARSSIASNQIAGMEQNKIDALFGVGREHTQELYRLTAELDSLESKKFKALADFDISYAARLALEIDALTAERDRRLEAALKYNNDIAIREAQYEADRKLNEQRILRNEYDLHMTVNDPAFIREMERRRSEEIFGYLNSYFATLSKEAALEELLSNPDIRASLDAVTFNRLHEIIQMRR
jgi:hypothetical protein